MILFGPDPTMNVCTFKSSYFHPVKVSIEVETIF